MKEIIYSVKEWKDWKKFWNRSYSSFFNYIPIATLIDLLKLEYPRSGNLEGETGIKFVALFAAQLQSCHFSV